MPERAFDPETRIVPRKTGVRRRDPRPTSFGGVLTALER